VLLPDTKVFNHPRLELVAAIAERPGISFADLQRGLGFTPGNLSAHLMALRLEGVVHATRHGHGRKALTTLELTETGRQRLWAHVGALGALAVVIRTHLKKAEL
jgi:DNA-binding MarR family transcriptional regulator